MRGLRLIRGFVGATQEAIGALAIVFSYLLYYNVFDVQIWLNISREHVYLYLVFLSVFGFVSILSGLFLIHEVVEQK